MQTSLLKQTVAVEKGVTHPFITIALQIDPTINSKDQLEQKMKLSVEKVENDLMLKGIPDYMAIPAVKKVKSIIHTLDNNTKKRSVIIYLSPFTENIYYLNYLIEEKAVVGEPLNMRELVLTKREEMKYLVLSLHSNKCYIYSGEGKKLTQVVFNSTEHLKSHLFTNKERFFNHVDNVLSHILKTYSLPLITIGTETNLSLLKSLSKNSNEFIEQLHRNLTHENASIVRQLIEPILQDWEKLKEKYLLMKLNNALQNHKAETGFDKVCKASKEKRGKLLIVEKAILSVFPAQYGNELISSSTVTSDGSLLKSNAVEDVIEMAAANGCNIELVSSNALNRYGHIALLE